MECDRPSDARLLLIVKQPGLTRGGLIFVAKFVMQRVPSGTLLLVMTTSSVGAADTCLVTRARCRGRWTPSIREPSTTTPRAPKRGGCRPRRLRGSMC